MASTSGDMDAEQSEAVPPGDQNTDSEEENHSDDSSDSSAAEQEEQNSSDNDEMDWQEIEQDDTPPSKDELKEMSSKPEGPDALDEAFWAGKLTTDFEDPEYRAGERGRIVFNIDNINGSRKQPNKELIMRSPIVEIDGLSFQIAVYPKGSGSNDLAVFLECPSLARERSSSKISPAQSTQKVSTPKATFLDFPIPMNREEEITQKPSTAAHVIMLAYNPCSTRVLKEQSGHYQFTVGTPDWGWSHFSSPITELGKRERCVRAPLLQDDKLSFVAYVQLIKDDTGTLYSRTPYLQDSFLHTGLYPLAASMSAPPALVATLTSWLLLQPFRHFLCCTTDLSDEMRRPVLTAFQTVLCSLHTIPTIESPAARPNLPVSTYPMEAALHWYGMLSVLAKCDVVEMWNVLKTKLDSELSSTSWKHELDNLFGAAYGATVEQSTLKLPIDTMSDFQTVVNQRLTESAPNNNSPIVLHIELERQLFDSKAREWRFMQDQRSIQASVRLYGHDYSLRSMICHEGSLKSGQYSSIMCFGQSKRAFYKYSDVKSKYILNGSAVRRLTGRQAMAGGKSDGLSISEIPYVLLYVREDISDSQSRDADNAPVFPVALQRRAAFLRHAVFDELMSSNDSRRSDTSLVYGDTLEQDMTLPYTIHAINSTMFGSHQGAGTITNNIDKDSLPFTHKFRLPHDAGPELIRQTIAEIEGGSVIHPAQVEFWPVEWTKGQRNRPKFIVAPIQNPFGLSSMPRPSSSAEATDVAVWCWYHVHKSSDLNELLRLEESRLHDPGVTQHSDAPGQRSPSEEQPLILSADSEDTIMSDADQIPEPPLSLVRVAQQRRSHLPPPPPGHSIDPSSSRRLAVFDAPYLAPPSSGRNTRSERGSFELAYFLKVFDPKEQTLRPIGMFFARIEDRIDHSVFRSLDKPRDHSRAIWLEQNSSVAIVVKRKKTFAQYKLSSGCIIVIRAESTDEEDLSFEAFKNNGFSSLESWLRWRSKQIAFPHRNNEHHQHSIKYFGRGSYEGPLLKQKAHGKGTKISMSGEVYSGDFKLGERHGLGRLEYVNGDVYEGEFVRDKRSGTGRLVEASTGNVYQGEWLKGQPHGIGVTHWKKAERNSGLCAMCWDEMTDAVLVDCGHIVGCLACSKKVGACPICRKAVDKAIRFYYA